MISEAVSLSFASTLTGGRALTAIERLSIEPLAEEVVEYIRDRWPVGNHAGEHSRDLWGYHIQASPPALVLLNDADYAEHVHRTGNPATLLDTLIPEALSRYGPEIRRTLTAAILTTQQRRPTGPVLPVAGARRALRSSLSLSLRRMGVRLG